MAITEKYVSIAGGGAHDGSTTSDSYTFTEMVTAINALAPAGAATRFNIQEGAYTRTANDVPTGDGTATIPIILRGVDTSWAAIVPTKDSAGKLVTTHFPVITYNSTFRWNGNGADHLQYENLVFAGSVSAYVFTAGTAFCTIKRVIVTNSSTNTGAGAIISSGLLIAIDCEGTTSATGAATAAALSVQSSSSIIGGRYTCPAGPGILITGTVLLDHVLVFDCGSDGIQNTTAATSATLIGCTLYHNGASGWKLAASTTGIQKLIGNHITDNAVNGVNINSSIAFQFIQDNNRFRDNTSGDFGSGTDWTTGGGIANITGGSGAAVDYIDAITTKNFALKSNAVGRNGNVGFYNDIGSSGSPVVRTNNNQVVLIGDQSRRFA